MYIVLSPHSLASYHMQTLTLAHQWHGITQGGIAIGKAEVQTNLISAQTIVHYYY